MRQTARWLHDVDHLFERQILMCVGVQCHRPYPLKKFPESRITAKVASQFGAFRVIRNGPRHFIMDRLASGDVSRSPADIQGLAMRPVAAMRLRLLDLVEKRAFYVERTIRRTTDWTFLAGKPVYELVSPKGQVYVMQSYSQIVDPSLAYADLAALGSRLKPPKGWQYRSRTLTADLVAPARGEAHIIQDELQNTYQRLPGP